MRDFSMTFLRRLAVLGTLACISGCSRLHLHELQDDRSWEEDALSVYRDGPTLLIQVPAPLRQSMFGTTLRVSERESMVLLSGSRNYWTMHDRWRLHELGRRNRALPDGRLRICWVEPDGTRIPIEPLLFSNAGLRASDWSPVSAARHRKLRDRDLHLGGLGVEIFESRDRYSPDFIEARQEGDEREILSIVFGPTPSERCETQGEGTTFDGVYFELLPESAGFVLANIEALEDISGQSIAGEAAEAPFHHLETRGYELPESKRGGPRANPVVFANRKEGRVVHWWKWPEDIRP